MKKRIIPGLIVIIVIVLFGIWWFWPHSPKVEKGSKTAVQIVTIQTLSEKTIPLQVLAYGSSIFPNSLNVLAKTDGNITSINFKPGQKIQKGQVLFTLHSNDVQNQVTALKAKMLDDKNNYSRYLALHKNFPGGATASQLTDYKLKYEQSKANYTEAKKLETVLAPSNGTISDTDLAVGSFVQTAEVVARLTNPSLIQVRYQLADKYASQAKAGQTVTFQPNGSQAIYKGFVSYVSASMDATKHLLTVRANLQNATNLKAHRFGQVTQVIDAKHQSLAIPQGFSQTDAKGFFVYTVEDNKLAKRYFTPGNVTASGWLSIKSGLKKGLEIVSSDASSLNEGETVQVKKQ